MEPEQHRAIRKHDVGEQRPQRSRLDLWVAKASTLRNPFAPVPYQVLPEQQLGALNRASPTWSALSSGRGGPHLLPLQSLTLLQADGRAAGSLSDGLDNLKLS